MQKLIIAFILFQIIFLKGFSQDTAIFTTGNEYAIDHYEIQDSTNGSTSWNLVASIAKGKSYYSYVLPTIPAFFRVKAAGDTTFFTNAIFSNAASAGVTITSASWSVKWFTDVLKWTTSAELNVNYFLLEKSVKGAAFTQVAKVNPKGSGNYTYNNSNFNNASRQYRITTFLKNGTQTMPIIFK